MAHGWRGLVGASIVASIAASAAAQSTNSAVSRGDRFSAFEPGAAPRAVDRGTRDIGSAAIFQDENPWGRTDNQDILATNGATVDFFGVADMGSPSLDLSVYNKVIVSSIQSPAFYDALQANRAWFEAYVNDGGLLDLHLAFQSGAAELLLGSTRVKPADVIEVTDPQSTTEL